MPLRRPQAFSLVLALAAVSCTPEDGPPTITGRTLVLVNNTDDEICEATVETLDGFVEVALLELGVDPPDEPFITYRWEDEAGMEQSPCRVRNGSVANCAVPGDGRASTIYSRSPYHLHELAHGVHIYALPEGMPVLQEGFAELLADRGNWTLFDPRLVDDWEDELGKPTGEVSYGIAHALVYETVQTYGLDGLRELWEELAPDSTGKDLLETYASLFGEDIVEVLLAEQRSISPHLMLSCDVPTASETLTPPLEVRVPEQCEPDVVGPDRGFAVRTQIVEVEEPGVYRLRLVDGSSGGAALYPCELQPALYDFALLWSNLGSDAEGELEAGRYLLETDYRLASGDAPATFVLERSD